MCVQYEACLNTTHMWISSSQVAMPDNGSNQISEFYWKREISLSVMEDSSSAPAEEGGTLPLLQGGITLTNGEQLEGSLNQPSIGSVVESDATFVSHGITQDVLPSEEEAISENAVYEAIGRAGGAPSHFSVSFGPLLGHGIAGKVYQCFDHYTGAVLAVKVLPISSETGLKKCIRELEALQNLSHPNIIRYIGCDYTRANATNPIPELRIFTSFAAGGSIARLVKSYGTLSESVAVQYMRQVFEGLQYLHSNGYAHRDIKGANILLSETSSIQIADFGSCKKLAVSPRESLAPESPSGQGTIHWMAPEVVGGTDGIVNWCAADIWSAGATLLELLSGKPPWSDASSSAAVMIKIASSTPLSSLPTEAKGHLSAQCKDFLEKCFTRDQSVRPSAAELLQHPFMLQRTVETSMSLAYVLRDFFYQEIWRLRKLRVLDVLSLGFEGPTPSARSSRNLYASARVQEQELLCVNDIRRVTIVCRKHLESTAALRDDVMWALRTLWGQWGSASDLLLCRMRNNEELVGLNSCSSEVHQSIRVPPFLEDETQRWEKSMLETLDVEASRTITICEEAARSSIRAEDAQKSRALIVSALGTLNSIFGHSSAPIPAPIRPAPQTALVEEDGVEVMEVGSNQKALLQTGILLKWLATARFRLRQENECSEQMQVTKYDSVLCTWRHVHQLGISISNSLAALQTILLVCSSCTMNKDVWSQQVQPLDEEHLSRLLSYVSVVTVSRAISVHNALCLLHEGRFLANMEDLLYDNDDGIAEFPDPRGDFSLGSQNLFQEDTAAYNQLIVMALADYTPENERELPLQAGDLVVVRHQDDSGWWEGETGGVIGWFPSNYCAVQHTLFPIEEESVSSRSEVGEDSTEQSH
eukprot:gb/GECG01007002.1/.p1 GENE.gb/GECG01007002.1/~~gb/GECG01007002.1/.p1  ORF type:complete len:873 (+),score=88.65 gb/GECG01007002.1/:1-2619(+)